MFIADSKGPQVPAYFKLLKIKMYVEVYNLRPTRNMKMVFLSSQRQIFGAIVGIPRLLISRKQRSRDGTMPLSDIFRLVCLPICRAHVDACKLFAKP